MDSELITSSTPNLVEFDPRIIPYQYEVINDVRQNFDYSKGVYEILLSGSVGSAKSILMAHLAVTHCMLFPGARVCLGRRSLPDLKDTIFAKICEHMEGALIYGEDYTIKETNGYINFPQHGSEIISRSWANKRYTRARSLELSMLVIEELTENNNDEFLGFYKEYRARVGRLPHVPENLVVCATNPDAPSHAAYDYFIVPGVEHVRG